MREEPIKVVGSDRRDLTIEPGDVWPLPYLGSKYTICTIGGEQTIAWARLGERVPASRQPKNLAAAVRRLKGSNGSFRITAHCAVITPVLGNRGAWRAHYVGLYDGGLEFGGIDNDPTSLQMGMYWTGFPFESGETWTVSPYARSQNRLKWGARGRRFVSTRRYPKLLDTCLRIRPRGGRVYLTESGHVWMNIPDGGISPTYRQKFHALQRQQLNELLQGGNSALLRLLFERVKATNTRPIYVGTICSFDHAEPPWTSFNAKDRQLGYLADDVADDELGGH